MASNMASASSSSASMSAASSTALSSSLESASGTVDVVYELSSLLNTGLERSTVSILIGLCECGVNPEALAMVVKELRREAEAMDVNNSSSSAAGSNSTGNAGRSSLT
jgi:mitotic-spindle organizing protein 1